MSSSSSATLGTTPLGSSQWQEARVHKDLRAVDRGLRARLLSIEHDALRSLRLYASLGPLPIFANARAGAWYVPPSVPGAAVCSFKSCDGHYGRWSSSLRRPNTHVFSAAADAKGVVIVDVTRRGKSWPDSFSKTVPIWCAVVNAIAGLVECKCENRSSGAVTTACADCLPLHVHPDVPESERDQIRTRLPYWLDDWQKAGSDLKRIVPAFAEARKGFLKPLRPLWLRPGRPLWQGGVPLKLLSFTPVICICACTEFSEGARSLIEPSLTSQTECGVTFPPRPVSFPYVQGAGDDEEAWSCGLTPEVFWKYRDDFMKIADGCCAPGTSIEIETQLQDKVSDVTQTPQPVVKSSEEKSSARNLSVPIWATRVRLASWATVERELSAKPTLPNVGAIIVLGVSKPEHNPSVMPATERSTDKTILWLPLTDRKGKLDHKYAFGRALGPCLSILRACCVDEGKEALVCCTAKNRDWSAGLAIAWLAWHCNLTTTSEVQDQRLLEVEFSEQGGKLEYSVEITRKRFASNIPKEKIRSTMLHFTSAYPQFQVSRPTLKQLNRFFSSPVPSSVVSELEE